MENAFAPQRFVDSKYGDLRTREPILMYGLKLLLVITILLLVNIETKKVACRLFIIESIKLLKEMLFFTVL
tara:strand:- start:3573 stop:3785 length:213 start_codon:yes stop_codon:yes gene_type:complete